MFKVIYRILDMEFHIFNLNIEHKDVSEVQDAMICERKFNKTEFLYNQINYKK